MKKIILSALMLSGLVTFAQEKPALTISGSVDVYASTNFNTGFGAPGVGTNVVANGTGLGMANVILGYKTSKAGFVADLAYGPRATYANMYAGPINQMYAFYNVNDKLTLTAGQFNTFYGYELISPVSNFNYSLSYLFNAGPFSHTGVKANYQATEDLSFLLAVTNPHSLTSGSNPNNNEQYGAQVGYKKQYLNVVYGAVATGDSGKNLLVDYTGGFNVSDAFHVGINAAYAEDTNTSAVVYKGAALYLDNKFSDNFTLGLRPEVYTAGASATATAFTLAANNKLTDNLTLKSELRYDTSKDGVIGFGANAFPAVKNTTALTVAAVYAF